MMAASKQYPFTWSKCSKEQQDGSIRILTINNTKSLKWMYVSFIILEYDSIYDNETSIYHSMIKSSPMNLIMPSKVCMNKPNIKLQFEITII